MTYFLMRANTLSVAFRVFRFVVQSERRLRSQHAPAVRAASYCPTAVQTSIITEGFRSLAEGEQVEFFVESGDDGRTKAVQVTGPSGAPPQVLKPQRAPVTIDYT